MLLNFSTSLRYAADDQGALPAHAANEASLPLEIFPMWVAQVPTAMLVDMLSGLSFPRLLEATRGVDPPPAAEATEAWTLRRAAALALVWKGSAAAQKAQVLLRTGHRLLNGSFICTAAVCCLHVCPGFRGLNGSRRSGYPCHINDGLSHVSHTETYGRLR